MKLSVDASVAIKWVVEEADSDQAESLRRFELGSIELMRVECSNVLWRLVHRGGLAEAEALAKLDLLIENHLPIQPTARLIRRALEIACTPDHPVYDCLYLAAAERDNGRLVTADTRLLNKLAPSRFTHLAIPLQTAAAD